MTDKCNVNLQLSRQNVLLLCRLIEAGLLNSQQPVDDEIIKAFPKEFIEKFKTVHEETLRKAELTEFYQRLKQL